MPYKPSQRCIGAVWRGLLVMPFAVLAACAHHTEQPYHATWDRPDLAIRSVKLINDQAIPVPSLEAVTLGALRGLEHALPADRFKVSTTGHDLSIAYRPGDERRNEVIFPAPMSVDLAATILSKAYAFAHRVAPEADAEATQNAMIKEALQAIDRPGTFYDAQEYQAMTTGTAGVGVMLQKRGDDIVISDTISGAPADLAGLRPGERLIAIDGAAVQTLELPKIVGMLRGPTETRVELVVESEDGRRRTVGVSRAMVVQRATAQFLEGGVAYVQLRSFGTSSQAEVAEALHLATNDLPKGVLLDLRHNAGGRLDSTVAVAGIFLDPGMLVARLEGRRSGPSSEELKTRRTVGPYRRPVVVLVDEETASGAEILAAALREYGKASLVGKTTFGNDSIDTVFPLPNGAALRLPTERWLTPNGLPVGHKGLTPDVVAEAAASPDHWLLTHDVGIHERMMHDVVFQKALDELRRLGGVEERRRAAPTRADALKRRHQFEARPRV